MGSVHKADGFKVKLFQFQKQKLILSIIKNRILPSQNPFVDELQNMCK